jgi:Tfp pilus assembly protein PilN
MSFVRLTSLMRLIPKTTIGIEITAKDIRIAMVREFGGSRSLVRTESIPDFLSLSEADRLSTLTGYFKKHKLSGFNVHLTFPGTAGVIRDLEFPAAAGLETTLHSAVALQVESLSPWPLDEIYWDCSWAPVTKSTKSIVVHVGIVPRQVVDPWIALFRSAGLALAGASLSSLSWAHGTTVFWGTVAAMVVAAEDNHVEGALIRDGRIYTACIEGNNSELVPACTSEILRAGRVTAVDQLRIVVYGATSDVVPDIDQLPMGGHKPGKSTFGAVATALLGLARTGFRLNLIPQQLRYQRNSLQFVPVYVLAFLLALLGIFATLREPYQQSLYAQRLDQEARRLAVEVRPVADQEAQLNRASDRLKALNGVLNTRDVNLEALRELSHVLPAGTWLTTYAYQDKVVTITGYSDSAATIQKLLEDSMVFHDAQFTASIIRDASGKDRFSIRASAEVRQ